MTSDKNVRNIKTSKQYIFDTVMLKPEEEILFNTEASPQKIEIQRGSFREGVIFFHLLQRINKITTNSAQGPASRSLQVLKSL